MRAVALMWAVLASGCGASLGSSMDVWHPTGQRSALDAEDRELLARMVVLEPTDDAMDAREHIDELGEVGDDDVRALLTSSLAWLDALNRAGGISRLRERCLAQRTSAAKEVDLPPGDVIGNLGNLGNLGSAPARRAHGPAPLEVATHLGLWNVWAEGDIEDEICRRGYRALRALAITRGWLGAHVDHGAPLAVFDLAISALSDGSGLACPDDEETRIRMAVTQHLYALHPSPWISTNDPCAIETIGGPIPVIDLQSIAVAHPPMAAPQPTTAEAETTTYDFADDLVGSSDLREGEESRVVSVHLGVILQLFLARRDGVWRVVSEGAHAIVG